MVDMLENQSKANHINLIYMYKYDLAIDNQQWLICHKTKLRQPNQIMERERERVRDR